jgi:hypothetical protein
VLLRCAKGDENVTVATLRSRARRHFAQLKPALSRRRSRVRVPSLPLRSGPQCAASGTAPESPDRGSLSLTNSAVEANTASATGSSTLAQGAGIFDAALPVGPFGGPLALARSSVTHNVLRGPAGATLQGGGIYLAGQPFTQTTSRIARNVPDQCFGCTATGRTAIRSEQRGAGGRFDRRAAHASLRPGRGPNRNAQR